MFDTHQLIREIGSFTDLSQDDRESLLDTLYSEAYDQAQEQREIESIVHYST